MLTGFPFSLNSVKVELRTGLPPANDVLPGNPGPFGGGDSHPSSLLLPPGSALPVGPLNLTAQLRPNRNAPLPNRNLLSRSRVSAASLAPSIFRALDLGG